MKVQDTVSCLAKSMGISAGTGSNNRQETAPLLETALFLEKQNAERIKSCRQIAVCYSYVNLFQTTRIMHQYLLL